MAPARQAAWCTPGEETLEACKNPQASALHLADPASRAATTGQAVRPHPWGWSSPGSLPGITPASLPHGSWHLATGQGCCRTPRCGCATDSGHRGSVPAQHRQVSVLRAWGPCLSTVPLLPIRSSPASLLQKTAFSQAIPIKCHCFPLCARSPIGCSEAQPRALLAAPASFAPSAPSAFRVFAPA